MTDPSVTACTASSGEGTCGCNDCKNKNKIFIPTFQALVKKFKDVFRIHSSVDPSEVVEVQASENDDLVTQSEGISDADKRIALKAALVAEGRSGCYIVAVFAKTFVYEEFDPESGISGFLERGYSISKGKVSLKEGAVQVRPETVFVPVTNQSDNQEEPKMADKAKVDALIANTATKFTEDDRTWLSALTDAQVDRMIPEAAPAANASNSSQAAPPATPAAQPAPAQTAQPQAQTPARPVTAEEYINSAPPEIREVLANGVRMSVAHRERLTAEIKANKANQFTDDELKTKGISELEKLATMARASTAPVANYDARPAPNSVTPVANAADRFAAPMPSLIVQKPAAQSNAA